MKLTFPHLGNTYICVKAMLDDLGVECVVPPFNNKKALELGTKYVPEMVCLPLKINIGNYIQAYEMGADTILMAGGCGRGNGRREALTGYTEASGKML